MDAKKAEPATLKLYFEFHAALVRQSRFTPMAVIADPSSARF